MARFLPRAHRLPPVEDNSPARWYAKRGPVKRATRGEHPYNTRVPHADHGAPAMPEPDDEPITEEQWIEASQSCCGADAEE
jgi:hypothetical protein